MIDREKVIEILNNAKTIIEKWVPMFEQYNTPAGIDDAITLLKEQGAKPPRVHENAYGRKFYYCPKCNRAFDCFNQESYCHDCGQEVKWNA